MSQNNKGLGRGLDALFHPEPAASEKSDSSLRSLSPDALFPNPDQPRKIFSAESLEELAASIRSRGVLQPLLARPLDEGRYQIIAGERRWRAAKMAGLARVPVVVAEMDDGGAVIAALIENIQREDLNPIEQARALARLKDALGVKQDELAEMIGQSRSWITNVLRLLRLDQAAMDDLASGLISQGHARCILAVPEGEPAQTLRLRIVRDGLSVREAEEAVGYWRENNRFPWDKEQKNDPPRRGLQKSPEFIALARQIGASCNCGAKISGTPDKGKISLSYESSEQFYNILDKLGLSLEQAAPPQTGSISQPSVGD